MVNWYYISITLLCFSFSRVFTLQDLPQPANTKLEFYERRKQNAAFDCIDKILTLMPGHLGKGAIVKGFINSIPNHDAKVKEMEEQMILLDGLKRDLKKKNRLYRNLDSAWNTVLAKPEEFEEYCLLLPKMDGIEERIAIIKDEKIKAKLQAELDRFKEIEPSNKILFPLKQSLDKARETRDVANDLFVSNQNLLTHMKQEEVILADLITDDHMTADELGVEIAQVFSNVRTGFIMSEINGVPVENLKFEAVIQQIMRSKLPHEAVFRRYDYRFNPFTEQWQTLQELREAGVAVENPMSEKVDFTHFAAIGSFDDVKRLLVAGEDYNAIDYTNNTALAYAALNNHPKIVKLLHSLGAQVDCRDKNLATPLLGVIRKGHIDMVKLLLSLGAKMDASDKKERGALYYAVSGGHLSMIKIFLKAENCNNEENVWGYTCLHIAAYQGNMEILKYLVEFGCSIYKKDNKGRTAEQVAEDAGHIDCHQFLIDERLTAPGQLVHEIKEIKYSVWIGDHSAIDPRWVADVGITHIIIITKNNKKPHNMGWLSKKDESIKPLTCNIDIDDDDTTLDSWEIFKNSFVPIYKYITDIGKKGYATLLVCDPTGVSTAPALVAITNLLFEQIRIHDTLRRCAKARPSVSLSMSLYRGLEKMQVDVDEKNVQRMKKKVRDSTMLSMSF